MELDSLTNELENLGTQVQTITKNAQTVEQKLKSYAEQLEEREKTLSQGWEDLAKEKSKIECMIGREPIRLSIGGKTYTTSVETLTKDKDSMLAAMFSGRFPLKPDKDGVHFIDRDGKNFRHILNFLRDDRFPALEDKYFIEDLYYEAKFYQITALIDYCEGKFNFNTPATKSFPFESLNDTGIIYSIATNHGQEPWTNPHISGKVIVTASSHDPSLNRGNALADVVNAVPAISFGTQDLNGSWIQIDFGVDYLVVPNYYRFANTRKGNCHPRSWQFQGSVDGQHWIVLKTHTNDTALQDNNQVVAWPILNANSERFRFCRVFQVGRSAQGNYGHLVCAGIEIFGTLVFLKDEVAS